MSMFRVHLREGRQAIKAIIRDDIAAARARGDYPEARVAAFHRALPAKHLSVAKFQPAAVEQQGALAERN
jgi:hypothetical protein